MYLAFLNIKLWKQKMLVERKEDKMCTKGLLPLAVQALIFCIAVLFQKVFFNVCQSLDRSTAETKWGNGNLLLDGNNIYIRGLKLKPVQ